MEKERNKGHSGERRGPNCRQRFRNLWLVLRRAEQTEIESLRNTEARLVNIKENLELRFKTYRLSLIELLDMNFNQHLIKMITKMFQIIFPEHQVDITCIKEVFPMTPIISTSNIKCVMMTFRQRFKNFQKKEEYNSPSRFDLMMFIIIL